MGTLQIAELNSFSGGMNNVTAPYLIRKDEAVVLINTNLRRGSLESVPRPFHRQDIGTVFFYQFNGLVYEYGSWRANVMWDNKWYWTDGVNTGKVHPDGTEYQLGLPTPQTRPDCVAQEEGPHEAQMKYCYTFYNSATGIESAPSPISLYVTPQQNKVVVTGFEAIPQYADRYRLYRIGGFLPYFQLVDTFDTLTYTDDLDDAEIDGTELRTMRNGPPPTNIHYFVEYNGRMFGAVNNLLYFSALGNPDSWYVFDFIPLRGVIKGLAKTPGGVLVLGDTWTNILKGTAPINFVSRVLSDSIGIIGAESLAYIDSTAIWLSNHGICMSDGHSIKQLTADRIEDVSGMHPTGAVVFNNIYHMSFRPSLYPSESLFPTETLYPEGVVGTGGVDQGILTLDFKRGQGYAYKIYEFENVFYIDELDGSVGVIHGDDIEIAFPDCEATGFEDCLSYLPCAGFELSYLHQVLEKGNIELDQLAQIEYLSPLLIDGSTAMLKEYDKVRILFVGYFTISVIFDDNRKVIENRVIMSDVNEPPVEALIGIPNEDNKSYSIRFEVIGRGTIKGIQYTFKNRELP